MDERNDLARQNAINVALAKKDGPPVPEDVILQDYVMLDFVEDFGELGGPHVHASDPA